MTKTTFAVDPANIPAVKRWLAAQDDPQGHLRSIDIDEILIGPGVLLDLPFVLQRAGVTPGSKLLLVVDETPMLREDIDLKRFVRDLLYVAGYDETTCHLEHDEYGLVHAEFEDVEGILWGLEPGTALIALGSGTVTDIAKHAAYLYDQQHPEQSPIVYICIPTANSVTAYAANMAVLLKDGVKRTFPSRYPTAIISDLLLLAGIAQSVVNMSAPISGTEHVTSHVLDMIAQHYHRGLALHGAQVGVATLTAARLYQNFLETFDPQAVHFDTCYPEHEQMQMHIYQLFQSVDPTGAMAEECWNDYSKKLGQWYDNRAFFEQFCQSWHSIHREKLGSLVCPPTVVQQILSSAG